MVLFKLHSTKKDNPNYLRTRREYCAEELFIFILFPEVSACTSIFTVKMLLRVNVMTTNNSVVKKVNNKDSSLLYYSTNKSLRTIYRIREDNRKKYTRKMNEWNELSRFVLENWDNIYLNAQFIEGADNLGVAVGCVEADYYAPERIYVRFTTKKDPYGLKHWVELHQSVGVKYVDGIRNYNTDKRFTPKQIMGVNLEVAKRALCVLGMKRIAE